MRSNKSLMIGISLLLMACQRPQEKPEDKIILAPDHFQEVRESQIERNRAFLKKERESIESYIQDRGWKMDRTGNGLYISMSLSLGKPKPQFKSEVKIVATSYLLDGTIIRELDSIPTTIRVGTDTRFELGFHEGLQLMEEGSTAKFILPSHLAHGLAGDLGEVPPMSALVYEVELIQIL